jgi:hypothetical protein
LTTHVHGGQVEHTDDAELQVAAHLGKGLGGGDRRVEEAAEERCGGWVCGQWRACWCPRTCCSPCSRLPSSLPCNTCPCSPTLSSYDTRIRLLVLLIAVAYASVAWSKRCGATQRHTTTGRVLSMFVIDLAGFVGAHHSLALSGCQRMTPA